MNLNKQKRLVARALGIGKNRVKINVAKTDSLKEAITRADLRSVVGTSIFVRKRKGTCRARAKMIHEQKKKGRKKGPGSKKKGLFSRLSSKSLWIRRVRVQRGLLSFLKEKKKITTQAYRKLYNMVKGGFFRSKAHLKLYISKMER